MSMECFLSNADTNPFPVEALKQHLDYLRRTEKEPEYVQYIEMLI